MNGKNIEEIKLPFPDKGERRVWIYKPEVKAGESLRVIYMTDGQNLFDKSATPYGCWEADGAVESAIKSGLSGALVVGIDNGNEYRDNELTPKSIGKVNHRGMFSADFTAQGEVFDDFLMNTVKKYVEENYPVRTDAGGNAVCGSSSGGLQAFFEGIEHPDSFGFVGALSPAFVLYSQSDWTSYLSERIKGDMPYLYLYCGANGELEQELYEGLEQMYELLLRLGYPFEKMNEVLLFENEHNEIAWREIFPDVLHTFLSGKFEL